ncbi:hypothetical protein FVO59_11960 [Microbacterium esteraromaticum]|uniref:Phage protein n=1 Tax=Microbacterium esteraromaticum TaxID=57043 RepID=A0A7D8AA37_9MICO|nr:hypothetical protein [Microbacterium esteraromaticum]QMU97840.1 hypothetical protein FVO59_11960 [Microbacterium esteraromaticum]
MAVTPDKIAVALGVTAPETNSIQWQQWSLWIDDATMLIENRAERLEVDLSMIGEAKLDYVIREAVVSQVKKPDDATQVTISVDDASSSRTYQSGKGRVSILDEWWAMLGLVEADEGAFAIDMLPGVSAIHDLACSLRFGATYCSCGADIAGKPIYGVE